MKKIIIYGIALILLINLAIAITIYQNDTGYIIKNKDIEIISSKNFTIYGNLPEFKWKYDKSGTIDIKFTKDYFKYGNIYCNNDEYIEIGKGINYQKIYNDCIDITPHYFNLSKPEINMTEPHEEWINVTEKNKKIEISYFADSNYIYDPQISNLTIGLVSCYPFDNSSYQDIISGKNLSVVQASSFPTINTTGQKKGSGALELRNTAGYAYNASISITSYPLTINCWVKQTNNIDDRKIFNMENSVSTAVYGFLKFGGDFVIWTQNGSASAGYSSKQLGVNSWAMITTVFHNNTNRKLYWNGTLDTTETTAKTYNALANTIMFGNNDGDGLNWVGLLDECSISSIAWNSTQITEVYNNTDGLSCAEIKASGQGTPPFFDNTSISVSLSKNETGINHIWFNWSVIGNYTNSLVYRNGTLIYNNTVKEFNDTGLINNTGYFYNITVRFNNTIYNSTTFLLSTNQTIQQILSNVSISVFLDKNETGINHIWFNWSVIGNYTNSLVYRNETLVYNNTVKEFNDTGLINNTGYFYNITVRFNNTIYNSTTFILITNQTTQASGDSMTAEAINAFTFQFFNLFQFIVLVVLYLLYFINYTKYKYIEAYIILLVVFIYFAWAHEIYRLLHILGAILCLFKVVNREN